MITFAATGHDPFVAIVLVLATICLQWLSQYMALRVMTGRLRMRMNYAGSSIPTSVGVSFVPALLLASFLAAPAWGRASSFALAVGVVAVSVAGYVDDSHSASDARGLRGHLAAALHGRVSSGLIKAVIGILAAAALVAAMVRHRLAGTPMGAADMLLTMAVPLLVVALNTNVANVLDLRPGRAGKALLTEALCVMAVAPHSDAKLSLFLYIVLVLTWLPLDLQAKAMMGDAGSNALGFALGGMTVLTLDPLGSAILLGPLLAIQVLAEVTSLSKWIERIPLLRFFDRLGRTS